MRAPARAMAAALALIAAATAADDTDIYLERIPTPAAEPLVMFSLDPGPELVRVLCADARSYASCSAAAYFRDNGLESKLPAAGRPFTRFDLVRLSLRLVLGSTRGFKVGLMLPHAQTSNCAGPQSVRHCSNGGYIARGFKTLDRTTVSVGGGLLPLSTVTIDGPFLTEFLNVLDSLPAAGSGTHQYQGKELFFELFRYLTGQSSYNARNGWTDYGTDDARNLDQEYPDSAPGVDWDDGIELLGRYVSPITLDLLCARIFTVNFVLGQNEAGGDDSDAAITAVSGGMNGIDLSSRRNRFATVLGYLNDVDLARGTAGFGSLPDLAGRQNVTSFFFARPTPADSQPASFDAVTSEYAALGGSGRPLPLSDRPEVLVEGLRAVLTQVLAVSSTYTAPSLPVNAFSRGEMLDQVFLGLFQPDSLLRPLWAGNVKKLKLRTVVQGCPAGAETCSESRELRLVDALGNDAVGADGRLRNEALTFWTDPARVAASGTQGVISGRDGRHVKQGGAGQQIPTPGLRNSDAGARQIYYSLSSGTSLLPLNADGTTAASLRLPLAAVTDAIALKLLSWVRGYDSFDSDADLNVTEVRPWLMGDPLHSRPVPINYGAINGHTASNPAIYIAVATNQGLLHFIRNTDTDATPESGREAWAYLPLELMGLMSSLAQGAATLKHRAGFDGTPVVDRRDVDGDGTIEPADGDHVRLYVGLRRGGRAYYALDVTDPAAPRLMWKAAPVLSLAPSVTVSPGCAASVAAGTAAALGCAADLRLLGCSGSFCELGYTFSEPRLGRVRTGTDSAGRAVTRRVVFFGGGYDPNKDYATGLTALLAGGGASPGSLGGSDSIGNAIFAVDAETGALLWKAVGPPGAAALSTLLHAEMFDSIPSTLTVADTDGDGLTDRILAGDTGGNVWRADLGRDSDGDGSFTDDWTLRLLARLGRHAGIGKAADRRFFHEPDLVQLRDASGPYDAVVIGSGDREDPLDLGRVRSGGIDLLTENALFVIKDRAVLPGGTGGAVLTPSDLADVTDGGSSASAGGWRLPLRTRGEKILAAPLTAAHRIYVTSYVPKDLPTLSCGPDEGTGRFYAVEIGSGIAAFNFNLADDAAGSDRRSAEDRYELMRAPGIPAEPVYVSLPEGDGGEVRCVLGSDLQCRGVLGATRFRTFWQRVEE